MNTSKHEFLSAWLDDESGAFEQKRLLDQLREDGELGQTLSRYALAGEAMRATRHGLAVARPDFLAGIQARLDEEPVYSENVVEFARPEAASVGGKARTGRTFMRYGMAASVALLAVAGGLYLQLPASVPAVNEPVAQSAVPAAVDVAAAPVSTRTVALAGTRSVGRLDPQTRDILKQYVAQHVKYASTTAIVPSIRAVSYANDY